MPVWRQVLFCLGLWTVYLSEGTPIHIMSELYLFSVHMVQHTLLTMVMPPLILLGTPEWALRPLLRRPWAKRILRTLVHPVPALLLFNLIYSIWHLPVLYQAILLYHWFHAVQHAILVATALLMWWPVCSPTRELPPLSEPGQMVYVFLAGLAQIAAFAVITFADVVLYPFYEEAPRLRHRSHVRPAAGRRRHAPGQRRDLRLRVDPHLLPLGRPGRPGCHARPRWP